MGAVIGKSGIEYGISNEAMDALGIKSGLVQDIQIRMKGTDFVRVTVELVPEAPGYLRQLFNSHELMLVKK